MDAWELAGPSTPGILPSEIGGPTEATDRARLAPLTGRDTEVSLLKDRWEQAQEGMGQVVLLIGEPGLGKSRLVSTIKQHVQSMPASSGRATPADAKAPSDSSIVEWRCSQRFQNTELYPVCDFFERLLCFGRDDTPAVRFELLARHLEEFDLARPDLLALYASMLLLPADGVPALGLSAVREREETFRALRQ